MGFFKDMHDLTKQAKEIDKTFDPGQQMRDGKARMAQAQQMMAQQTLAANLAVTGADATGTISAVRDTGTFINMAPVLEIDILIFPSDGRPPYPITTKEPLQASQMPRAVVGGQVRVKVDQTNPALVWVDWFSPAPA